MKYFDQNTNPERFPNDVQPLLAAMLENKQIRYEEQDNPPQVTEAIKFDRKQQDRRQTSNYDGDDQFVDSVNSIFGFDPGPLDFQVNSWQTVDTLDQERLTDGESKAAVFSAPTGFGKTEAFLGPLYKLLLDERQESVAIVYPSRALLQDQLGRILKHLHQIKTNFDDKLSVGCYIGNMPWDRSDVGHEDFFEAAGGYPRFRLCNCWCGDEETTHPFKLYGGSRGYSLKCENDQQHEFTNREVVLSRKDLVFNNQPDIVLTTLESLENFAHKPHYPLIDLFDTIVLDEVHLYTGLRGAHAAKIISNVDQISDNPLLWIGSSATIDDAERFGRKIFDVPSYNLETEKPPQSDYDDDHDDYENYYFMLASEDGPGVTSMAIQQSMLLGHTMLENQQGQRTKQLSFIDSISQINQQRVQFRDADHTERLWQYHREDLFNEDWDAVAAAMDQRFIDEPLDFMPVYSEQGFDRETAASSDVFLSTNFLEVGIDVGEIKTVTQHRTPWDLSSFLQRAGRAARKPGMSAHIVVYLSNLTSDSNMFYRADRFLDSNIRTPLNTNNHVVEWMHDRFIQYYKHISELDDQFFNSTIAEHSAFLERYLNDELEYKEYYRMIVEPHEFFSDALGIEVPPDRLFSSEVVEDIQSRLDTYREQRHEELSDIESYFGMDDGEIIRGTDAIDTYVHDVQEQTLRVINTFDGQVTGFSTVLARHDCANRDAATELSDSLAELKTEAQEIRGDKPSEIVAHFSSLLAELFGLTGDLMQLRNQANSVTDDPAPQVKQDRLTELNKAVNQLETLCEDDRLQQYYQLEKQIYYLQTALDEYRSYIDQSNPYNSLYRIKDLLRGAYYFDLYLQTTGDQLADEIWFVPPDYFGSAGQFVRIHKEGAERSEESIDQVLSTYAPYYPQYQSESGVMQMFLPKTTITEDGVEMDFTRHVTGEKRAGVLVPDEVQLSSVKDLSEESAMEIVQYCPECYQILSQDIGSCLRHEQKEVGKIHSEPHIDTSVTDRMIVEQTGELSLADLEARVTLESVTLEITPGEFAGEDIGYIYDTDKDRFTQEIESPDTPLGYTTRTRGLVYDINPFLDQLNSSLQERVERYKDTDTYNLPYLAHHTAAHFLMQLVTDVSGVNTQRVFYGFDEDSGEVYVFERTEGGQGIVDLVYDELHSDPGSILESMNRLLYNEQVINERLWADESFVDSLPTATTDEETVRSIVRNHLSIPFDAVVDRVTREAVSTIDGAHQFATDEDITVEAAYQLKHIVSLEHVDGTDEFPIDAVMESGIDISDADRVKTTFYSPDIDGCVENLHITECIAGGEQSETLSYIVLEALRDYLLDTVDSDETTAEMFDAELPPGGEVDGTSVFLDF